MRFNVLYVLALKLISLRESLRLTRRVFVLNDIGARCKIHRTFTIRRGFATAGGVENGAKYEITALLRTDTTTVTNIKIA